MSPDRRLWLIYSIILLDVVIGAAIGPVLPEFVRGLAQPQLWMVLGTGIFLGVQLFSAPVLGRLSDGWGRRPILVLSAMGTLLATALLFPARAALYFANRFSDGLTNGMYATIRAAITDISPPERLFRNLGIEGAIISLGFVLGPMASGAVLTIWEVAPQQQVAYVIGLAVALAALNVGLSLLLRETHTHRTPVRGAELRAELTRAINPLTLWQRLRAQDTPDRGLRPIVLMQVALTLSTGYYAYFVPFISMGELQLDARGIAYFFMFFGVLSVVINYLFYTYIADRLNQRRAIFWLAALGVPILVGYGFVGQSLTRLYVLTALDCLTLSLIQGLLEGLLAQRTTDADRGEIFGLNQAVQGLASFVSTLVLAALSVVDLRLPWWWFAVCLAMVAWQARQQLRQAELPVTLAKR